MKRVGKVLRWLVEEEGYAADGVLESWFELVVVQDGGGDGRFQGRDATFGGISGSWTAGGGGGKGAPAVDDNFAGFDEPTLSDESVVLLYSLRTGRRATTPTATTHRCQTPTCCGTSKQGGPVRGEIALSGVVARMAAMRHMKMKYPAAFELVHPSQRPYYSADSGEVADECVGCNRRVLFGRALGAQPKGATESSRVPVYWCNWVPGWDPGPTGYVTTHRASSSWC